MLLELLLKDERKEAQLQEAIEMLRIVLEKFGKLPDSLLEELYQQRDIEVIRSWMRTASRAQSLDEFISKM